MPDSHFDLIASQYENSLPAHINRHYLLKRIRFIKGVLPKGFLVDVGCGTGTMTEALADGGFQVFGVDYSFEMLRIAVSKNKRFYAQATAGVLPFPDEEFDMAVTIATLHHFADHALITRAIDEMLRITRPGGYVLIWDHNPRNPYWKILMKRVPQDSGDERLISHQEILGILAKQRSMIKSIRVMNSGFIPDFIPQFLMPLAGACETFLEKIPLVKNISAHNVILIQRG